MTPLQLISLAGLIALSFWDLHITRSIGGTRSALAVTAAVDTAALGMVAVIGGPLGACVGAAILALSLFGREWWLDALDLLRPEAGLFASYRRLYQVSEAERVLDLGPEREKLHAQVLAELAEMEKWRSANTGDLIDLLRRSYALRFTKPVSQDERMAVAVALDDEMNRVWGPVSEQAAVDPD